MNTLNKISKTYFKKIQETSSDSLTINLPTGQISITESSISDGKMVNKKVNPGSYEANYYWVDDETFKKIEASPTVGIEMIVVHFSDKPIDNWEEVKDLEGDEIVDGGNLIDFLMYDNSFAEELENDLYDEIENVKEDCYSEGVGVIDENKAINLYVGEVCFTNKFYWALDADENPVKLIGLFQYSNEDADFEEDLSAESVKKIGLEKEINLKIDNKELSITIPNLVEGEILIEYFDDHQVEISVGEEFDLEISETTISKDDGVEVFIKKTKKYRDDSGFMKNIIMESSTLLFWEHSEKSAEEFMFTTIVKAGDKYYQIREVNGRRPFTKSSIQRMIESALTLKEK